MPFKLNLDHELFKRLRDVKHDTGMIAVITTLPAQPLTRALQLQLHPGMIQLRAKLSGSVRCGADIPPQTICITFKQRGVIFSDGEGSHILTFKNRLAQIFVHTKVLISIIK